jgi:hypothetical protein
MYFIQGFNDLRLSMIIETTEGVRCSEKTGGKILKPIRKRVSELVETQ